MSPWMFVALGLLVVGCSGGSDGMSDEEALALMQHRAASLPPCVLGEMPRRGIFACRRENLGTLATQTRALFPLDETERGAEVRLMVAGPAGADVLLSVSATSREPRWAACNSLSLVADGQPAELHSVEPEVIDLRSGWRYMESVHGLVRWRSFIGLTAASAFEVHVCGDTFTLPPDFKAYVGWIAVAHGQGDLPGGSLPPLPPEPPEPPPPEPTAGERLRATLPACPDEPSLEDGIVSCHDRFQDIFRTIARVTFPERHAVRGMSVRMIAVGATGLPGATLSLSATHRSWRWLRCETMNGLADETRVAFSRVRNRGSVISARRLSESLSGSIGPEGLAAIIRAETFRIQACGEVFTMPPEVKRYAARIVEVHSP